MKPANEPIPIPLFLRPAPPDDGIAFGLVELLKWVWLHSKSEVPTLVFSMIVASSFSGLSSLSLLFVSKFIDQIAQGFHPQQLLPLAGLLLGISILIAALRLLAATLGAYAGANIRRNLEVTLFGHLSRLPFHYLEEKSHGRITAALMAEAPMVAGIVPMIIRCFIRAPVAILVVLGLLIYVSPYIALMSLLTLPLFFLGVSYFTRKIRQATKESFQGISNLYAKMQEDLGGVRVARCLGLLDYFAGELQDLSRDIAKTSRRSAILAAFQGSLQETIALVILVGFLIWLADQVLNGRLTIGQALFVPAVFVYLRTEILALSGGYIQLKSIEGAANRLRDLLSTSQEDQTDAQPEQPLDRVVLDDVSFAYPNGATVLEHVHLRLLPGQFTVIIGESGAGKSTLCDLALRLRTPTAGKIFFNELPIEVLGEEYLRATTALVEQEPFLFEGSIRQNLLLACPEADEERLWAALTAARAADFVRALAAGLEAEVGQRGVKLSVGQKQRIVLARALIRKPRFLVLDEFTSSLDVANEAEIIEALAAAAPETIILCATHRASVVARADAVYILERGRLRPIDPAECMVRLGAAPAPSP